MYTKAENLLTAVFSHLPLGSLDVQQDKVEWLRRQVSILDQYKLIERRQQSLDRFMYVQCYTAALVFKRQFSKNFIYGNVPSSF